MGTFRYGELASLARRGARYASVHGTQYSTDTGNPAAVPEDIFNNAIAPHAAALDSSKLGYSISYNSNNQPYTTTNIDGQPIATANTVSVTVSYQWVPEIYFGGVTLRSTSVMPMHY